MANTSPGCCLRLGRFKDKSGGDRYLGKARQVIPAQGLFEKEGRAQAARAYYSAGLRGLSLFSS